MRCWCWLLGNRTTISVSGVVLTHSRVSTEREFFIDNLLVRIHLIILMTGWTGLAPWEFEFSFPGSLASAWGQVPPRLGLVTFSTGKRHVRDHVVFSRRPLVRSLEETML